MNYSSGNYYGEQLVETMKSRLFLLCTVLAFLCCLFYVCKPCQAAAPSGNKRVVIFVLDSISYSDLLLSQTPNIDALAAAGALGLMNTTTASGSARAAAHLTIGAGARASGKDTLEPAVEVSEQTRQVYQRRMGIQPRGNVLHLGMGEIISSNSSLPARVVPGALGQALAEVGLDCCLLGNSDLPGQPMRPAAGIIMDTTGIVEEGIIGPELLQDNPEAPYGLETDTAALIQAFQEVSSPIVVIDWGDTARADSYNRFYRPSLASAAKYRAIERADAFLGQLLSQIDLETTFFMIIVPAPSAEGYPSGERLTPIVMAGTGITPGLLTSPTTRRVGLVANTDIAPTILNYYRISIPYTMSGRPVTVTPADNPRGYLSAMHEVYLRNFSYRPRVLKTYIVFILLVLASTLYAIYQPDRWHFLLSYLLVAIAAVPLVLLLLPLIAPKGLVNNLLVAAILTALLVKLVSRGKHGPQPFIYLGLATVGLLMLDLSLEQSLLLKSFLGYCPIIGARYYGIGNEYMGVFLGAGLIGLSGIADEYGFNEKGRSPLLLIIPGFLLMLFYIASPRLGANLGGTIATLAGFGTIIQRLQKPNIQVRQVLIIAFSGVLLLISFGLTDYIASGSTASHFGQTVGLIINGGPGEILTIIRRKLEMNLKLLKYSWWSMILLLSLISFFLLSCRPPRYLDSLTGRYPTLWAGLAGGGTGALVAFLVNDSGVVAGATALLFPLSAFLFLLLQENRKLQ